MILIVLFGMAPKQATIAVYGCIFGSALGNIISQSQRIVNKTQVINYRMASITIPIVFIGALLGVMVNQLLPSVVTISFMIGLTIYKTLGILNRFRQDYAKETQELESHGDRELGEGLIEETRINPFSVDSNI